MNLSPKTYMFVCLSRRPDLERSEEYMRSTFDIWPDDDGHRYHYNHNCSPMNVEQDAIGHSQIGNHDSNYSNCLNFAKMNGKNHLTMRRGQSDLRY